MAHSNALRLALMFAAILAFNCFAKAKLPTSVKQLLLTQNYQSALTELQTLAARGNNEAQYQLALLYLNDRVEASQPLKSAEHWLTRCAPDNAKASYLLGSLYAKGERLTKDISQAKKWLSLADAQGHVNAKGALAKLDTKVDESDIFKAIKHGKLNTIVKLNRSGAKFDVVNANRQTPLQYAIETHQRAIATYMLGRMGERLAIDHQDKQGNTALHLALLKADQPLAQQLVNQNAQLNIKNVQGKTPIQLGATSGISLMSDKLSQPQINKSVQMRNKLKALTLQAKDPDSPYFKWRKLSIAVAQKQQDVVSYLLGKYADPLKGDTNNAVAVAITDNQSDTAITLLSHINRTQRTVPLAIAKHWFEAIIKHEQVNVLNAVLKLTDLNDIANLPIEQSPLKIAIREDKPSIVDMLLNTIAYEKQLSLYLLFAVQNQNILLSEKLIQSGAALDTVDGLKRNALWYGADLADSALIELLLKAKAKVGIADHQGITPLMRAIVRDCYDCAAHLLLHGADATQSSNTGNSALMFAAMGKVKLLGLVLKRWSGKKVDLSQRNHQSMTALMLAVQNGCAKCVSKLLRAGANPYRKNEQGQNAFDLAKDKPKLQAILNH